ncbi:hypothetical protein STEG23_019231 [Scotinomys teguina]
MVSSSIAGWRLLSCCLALDSSSSFPCPAFRAIAKSAFDSLKDKKMNLQRLLELGLVLAVDIFIFFHQLLDEDSLMTVCVFTNLITGNPSSLSSTELLKLYLVAGCGSLYLIPSVIGEKFCDGSKGIHRSDLWVCLFEDKAFCDQDWLQTHYETKDDLDILIF